VATTLTNASRSEYQTALEFAWDAIAAAHWSDAARAYQRATELLCPLLKTEPSESVD
jgi:hypothetical protein